jgi:hypothetical protein
MEPLDEILDLERRTADLLDAERAKAASWLDETRRGIEQQARSDEARLRASAAADDAAVKREAGEQAAAIVARAQSLARRARDLDDRRLKPIVWKHVAAIVPKSEP